MAVIEGGKDLFERERIRVVQFEYGGTYIDSRTLLRDFFDFFKATNYHFFLLYPSWVYRITRYDQRLENFQYKNILIVNQKAMVDKKIFQQN